MKIDFKSIELDGIDSRDYPDFCDAFICYAEFENGTPLNDAQLDELNTYDDLVYSETIKRVF